MLINNEITDNTKEIAKQVRDKEVAERIKFIKEFGFTSKKQKLQFFDIPTTLTIIDKEVISDVPHIGTLEDSIKKQEHKIFETENKSLGNTYTHLQVSTLIVV